MTRHKCPVGECDAMCPWDRLMCAPHWYMIPEDMRVRVWRHWRMGVPTAEYQAVRQSAIALVNALVARERG